MGLVTSLRRRTGTFLPSLSGFLHPATISASFRQHIGRARTDTILKAISRAGTASFDGEVLVDAMWDNPNYWIRFALFRGALGLATGREIALLGRYRQSQCRGTLARLGIQNVIRFSDLVQNYETHRHHALRLLDQTQEPSDILRWELPGGLPPDILYDGLLKRQRLACVNLEHDQIVEHVAEALAAVEAAERLFDTHNFKLAVLSHPINFDFGSVAWSALKRGIPVALLYGNMGVLRFVKLFAPEHMAEPVDRPTPSDIDALSSEQQDALARVGEAYLSRRYAGQTGDLGGTLAYKNKLVSIDRAALAKKFGWDPALPIIGVYASNWFDFPHFAGMTFFRDFLDWLMITAQRCAENPYANWLFKGHPLDAWYGGVTLADLMPPLSARNVALADNSWNGANLVDALDGLVTVSGTAGIEFAAAGKPVLVADRGWYHDCGFVTWPKSREEYLNLLQRKWWEHEDLIEATSKARVYLGIMYGRPRWQGSFVLEDDSVQWRIYEHAPQFLEDNYEIIEQEIQCIRDWFASSKRVYHTRKMMLSSEYSE